MGLIGEIFADVGLHVDSSGLTSATSMFKSAETSLTGISNVAATTSTKLGSTFTTGLNSAGTAVSNLAQKSVSLSDSMGRMNTVILGLATGTLVSAFTDVISVYAEFDDQMRKVQAVTEATGEQFSALTEEAKQLGADTSFTAQEVAEGMTILGQAGWDANEVMETIPGTLDLARSSMTGLSTSVDIMTTTMVGFQMEADESGRAADVLAKAANISATDITGIGEAMKYTSSLANEMGWSLEDTTAAIGLLSNAGIKGSMAGTVLRNSISRLISPTNQTCTALAKYGISLESVNPETQSLAEIIDVLSASGMSAGDVMTIFGQRAGPGMLALLSQGSGALRTYSDELENSTGYAEEAAEKMDAGLGGAIRKLQGAFETFQITVGEDFAYTFTKIIDLASELIDIYQYIPSSVRKVGTAFAALATGGLGVITAMGTIGMLISAAAPAFAYLGITAAGVSGALFGIVAPAAAVAIALIYLDEKTGLVSDTLSFLYDAVTVDWYVMKNVVGDAIESISGYIDGLISDFNSLGTGLHLDGITGFFSSIKESISGVVSSVHEQAEEYRNASKDIETNIFDASSQVQDSASTAETAHDGWGDSAKDLASTVEEAYKSVTGSASEAQSEYQKSVDKFLGDIDTVNTAGIELMSGVDLSDLTRGIETVDGELIILNDDLELVKISADGTITPLRDMGEINFQTTSGGLTVLTQGANDTGEAMGRADTLAGDLDQDVVVLNGRTLSGLNGQVGTVQLSVSDTTRLVDEVTGRVSILDSKTLSNLAGQINGVDSSINTANGTTGTWGDSLHTTDLIPMSTLLAQTQGVDSQIKTNTTDTGTLNSTLGTTNNSPFSTIQGNLSATGSSIDTDTTKTGIFNSTLGGTNTAPFSTIFGNLGTTGSMVDTDTTKTGTLNSTLGTTNNSPFGTLFGNLSTGGTHVDTLKGKTDNANDSMGTLGGFSFSTTLSSLGSIYNKLGDIYDRAIKTIDKLRNIGSSSSSSSSSNSSKSGSSKTTTNTTNNTVINVNTKQSSGNVISQAKRAAGK